MKLPRDYKIPYKTRKIVLSEADLHKLFKLMEHPRPLKEAQVAHISNAMKKGTHFDTPFVVNDISTEKTQRLQLIDGGHRLEAMKRFFRLYSDKTVEVTFHVYDHLNDQEAREVYDKWSKAVRATLSDRIHVNQEDFKIFDWISTEGFPTNVSIYGVKKGGKGFRFTVLMGAYLGRVSMHHGAGGRLEEVLARVKRLDHEDYLRLKQFAKDFIEAFGQPDQSNSFSRSTAIYCLMKTYFANLQTLGREEIVRRWKVKVLPDAGAREWCTRGLFAIKETTEYVLALMNKGHSKQVAVTVMEYRALQGLAKDQEA